MFELTPEQERDVIALALATLQESQPAWRKADLIRCLGELLPDNTICRDHPSAPRVHPYRMPRLLANAMSAWLQPRFTVLIIGAESEIMRFRQIRSVCASYG